MAAIRDRHAVSAWGDPMTSPQIQEYLDELASCISGSGTTIRRLLSEAEAHLVDAAERRQLDGLDPESAATEAIAAFGSPQMVAAAARRAAWRSSSAGGVIATVRMLARLAVAGLLAIGASGVLAAAGRALGLAGRIFGLPANVRMPAASCLHWLAVQPSAGTCQAAGTLEAADDLTALYLAAGVVGVIGAVALWLLNRTRLRDVARVLPAVLEPAVGLTLFGCAALVLGGLGTSNAVVFTMWGAGLWWIDACCALVVTGVAGVLLVRAVARSSPSGPVSTERARRR